MAANLVLQELENSKKVKRKVKRLKIKRKIRIKFRIYTSIKYEQ